MKKWWSSIKNWNTFTLNCVYCQCNCSKLGQLFNDYAKFNFLYPINLQQWLKKNMIFRRRFYILTSSSKSYWCNHSVNLSQLTYVSVFKIPVFIFEIIFMTRFEPCSYKKCKFIHCFGNSSLVVIYPRCWKCFWGSCLVWFLSKLMT